MKFSNMKQVTLTEMLIYAVLGVLAGLLLILIPTDFLLQAIFVVMGVLTVLYNIPGFVAGLLIVNTRMGLFTVLLSAVSILTGILMIFWHADLLMIFLGAYMVVFPIVEVLMSEDKSKRLGSELPKIIIGLVLLLIGPSTVVHVMFDVAGWVVIALTAIYVLFLFFSRLRRNAKLEETTGNRIFVDVTGDGKIDVVYHDTDGDGKPDVKTEYKENK